VIGNSGAKIAQLTDGIAAAERLPSLRTDYRARVDRYATAESQIAHRAKEEVRFLNYVENKGTLRARGSPQSSLLSFEVLNILSAFAVTKEGMEVTKDMMMTQPGVFLLCGVPAFVLERIRGMQRPCREPLNALVHGDDRHTVNQEEEESFLTPCGVVAINRCPISNKSGIARFDQHAHGIMSTFAAHAINIHDVYVVSGTRRFVKMNGVDGVHPTLGLAPFWVLVGVGVASDDRGYAILHKKAWALVDNVNFDQIAAAAVVQSSTDALPVRKEIRQLIESQGEKCTRVHSLSLALVTYSMPSRPPRYLSVEEARIAVRTRNVEFANFLSADPNSGPVDSLLHVKEESHIDVYDEVSD
jgi:hypothetical protein